MQRRRVPAAMAVAVGAALLAVPLRCVFESNLHPVIAGQVYRSAQPSGADLEEWIRTLSLRTVVNLRGEKSDDDRRWLRDELGVTERAGIEHVSIRMSSDDLPPAPTLRKLVETLDTAKRPLLLHCAAGAERSALASAVAVLLATGDLAAARAEFALDKGFVRWLNPQLPRVLDQYETWLAEQHAASTPDRFRDWVATEYAPYFYRARIEPLDTPALLAVGVPARLRFRVTNTSREPIPFRSERDRGVHLGARIVAPDGAARGELRGGFVDLALAPGASVELELAVPALAPPGAWSLEVDLVDEGVKWFGALGSVPLALPIEVAAAP
jgi:protein tyrosine/serine phosphatase